MVTEIVIAAFKTTERNSIAYRRYQTIEGCANGIAKIIRELEPDYISVRVIQ